MSAKYYKFATTFFRVIGEEATCRHKNEQKFTECFSTPQSLKEELDKGRLVEVTAEEAEPPTPEATRG